MKCKIVSYLPCFIILALAVAVELHNNINNTQGCRFDPWPCAWMEQCSISTAVISRMHTATVSLSAHQAPQAHHILKTVECVQ